MKIDVNGLDIRARHERFALKQPVKVVTSEGSSFQAQSENLSRSGMALALEGPVMENGQFLELHMDGLGSLTGHVARTYAGGVALRFEKLLAQNPVADAQHQKLDKLA